MQTTTMTEIPILNVLRYGSNWATCHIFVFSITRSDDSGSGNSGCDSGGGVWGTSWLIDVLISLQLLRWAVRGEDSGILILGTLLW